MKKKSFLIIICTFVLLAGFGTFLLIRHSLQKKAKELNVVFCDVSENVENYLKSVITEEYNGVIKFKKVEKADLLKNDIKKADLLFTWKGNETNKLSESAKSIPSKALDLLPRSLKKQSEKTLPLLVDPYVLDYYIPAANAIEQDYPLSFEDLETYLYGISGQVFSPFFCAGGEDENLIALIGSIIQSKYGAKEYGRYIEDINQNRVLKNEKTVEALDILKNWAEKGLIHPLWYLGNTNDVEYFVETKQIGVLFQSLSSHRNIKYNDIKNFEMIQFPISSKLNDEYGVVGSELVCMNFIYPGKSKAILIKLVSELVQSNLSSVSMLGPVALRGESFDIQADDARFYVASCASGILVSNSVGTAAEEIRKYLK